MHGELLNAKAIVIIWRLDLPPEPHRRERSSCRDLERR
jgi:hypothetical protein